MHEAGRDMELHDNNKKQGCPVPAVVRLEMRCAYLGRLLIVFRWHLIPEHPVMPSDNFTATTGA